MNRYYDGNRREVKRGGQDFTYFPNGQSRWIEHSPIYYIRSSIFANEVINEVDSIGKRVKGYVRAAGTTLAVQTGALDNPPNQFVYFEQQDASQMSYRATQSNGIALGSEGYDGAPAELDPLGGNMGVSTPYIEPLELPPPENQYLIPLNFGSPMYVNGQQVTATLDGIEVPLGLAFSALQNGSADINFRNTDSFLLAQLGIFAVWRPDSGRTPPPDTNPDTSYGDAGTWEYYFSNISWSLQPNPPPAPTPTSQPTPSYPDCQTFYDLIYNNDVLKKFISDLWSQTFRAAAELHYDQHIAGTDNSGDRPGEVGGVAFFDEADRLVVLQQYSGYRRTKSGESAGLPDDFLQQLEKFKQDRKADGNSERILLIFHTHPPDMLPSGPTGEAYSKYPSTFDSLNINHSAYGVGPLFGILITGDGKFKVYGAGKSDDETLKRTCIPSKR